MDHMPHHAKAANSAKATHHQDSASSSAEPSANRSSLSEPSTELATEAMVEGGGNRELTWLEFNRRVLHEALDDRTPLLERMRFLAIFTSNLDEFVQKRVGGLKRQLAAGLQARSPDGMTAKEQLTAIRDRILEMQKLQAECYLKVILPELAKHGIHLLNWDQLTDADKQFVSDYYRTNLFPVLTPLAVDPGHPFPFISNLSTSVGVRLRNPKEEDGDAAIQFARVKVPSMLPAWVRLPDGPQASRRYIKLLDVIRYQLQDLFQGMVLESVEPFRITRNADVERDEEDAEDLLELIAQELRERRFAKAVRLEVDAHPDAQMTHFLTEQLELDDSDVYSMPAELDYTTLFPIADLDAAKLRYDPWMPVVPTRLADPEGHIFQIIRQGDLMVHHPYESFTASVERFISEAANDPKVVAIKLTLYRTSKDSPFIPQLIRAAENGKQVVALVELKARFDEERNIQIAQQLEKAGVHVVYGIVGLKTHTKTAMVVRHESQGMRVYAHIGTGNYNPKTAQLYTDLGLFTCRPEITADVVELFHYLTGRSIKQDFKHLLIAPINMRRRFNEMIDREIAHAKDWVSRGSKADDPNRPRIVAKMNSLEDMAICKKLYEASAAGVKIDLIVRGFCCLTPGVPGLSENIRVVSVIGRFLEHSRIFCFHNQGQSEYFIGSADWMYRNLSYRVECIVPVYDPVLQQRLRSILDLMLSDRRQTWDMHRDGHYVQRQPLPDQPDSAIGVHQKLMALAKADGLSADR